MVHVRSIVSVVELGPLCVLAEVPHANVVPCFVVDQIVAAHGHRDLDDSARPSVVVASVDHCEGSVLDCNFVEGPLEGLGGGDANEGELFVAGLISFEGVAVVAGESARPIVIVVRPHRRLESQSLLYGLQTELIHARNPTVVHSLDPTQ